MSTRPENSTKSLLILIGDDPRTSSRPAEAVRVAAGIGAWKKVRVNVYLHGPALECAMAAPEELEEGELIGEHLPAILANGGELFGEKPARPGWIEVTPAESAATLLAGHDASMNFGVPDAVLGLSPDEARLPGAEWFNRIFPPGKNGA